MMLRWNCSMPSPSSAQDTRTPPNRYVSEQTWLQVVYQKPADILKHNIGLYVNFEDRIALQSAFIELLRLLCWAASQHAGYQVEEIVQACPISVFHHALNNHFNRQSGYLHMDWFILWL